MANSVSLSTDMSKLLFTDSSGTSEIDLNGDGAILRLNDGDLSAEPADAALSGSGIIETTINAQWTITYNEVQDSVYLIGIEDLDTSITVNHHEFGLMGKKLNIRRIENNLILILK